MMQGSISIMQGSFYAQGLHPAAMKAVTGVVMLLHLLLCRLAVNGCQNGGFHAATTPPETVSVDTVVSGS